MFLQHPVFGGLLCSEVERAESLVAGSVHGTKEKVGREGPWRWVPRKIKRDSS